MKKYRVITVIGTSYVVRAHRMVTSQSGVMFAVDTPLNGYIETELIAYARDPLMVYEVSSVEPDPEVQR